MTMATQGLKPIFGQIVNGAMMLNRVGLIVEKVWLEIPTHIRGVNVDTFVIMPNHMHGIIEIEQEDWPPGVGAWHAVPQQDENFERFGKPVRGSVPTIIRSFKSEVSKGYHEMANNRSNRLWQPNFYEHVIRNERDHQAIYDYILANPQNWEKDEEYF